MSEFDNVMQERDDNPANTRALSVTDKTRVPMSLPVPKLAVPDIPGYHLHWMLGSPNRIAQAQRAGYEFVDADEVNLANFGLADDAATSGNTDMGSRVSVVAGGDVSEGEQRLYLMKIKQEWWDADQKALEARNEKIAASLRGVPEEGDERSVENAYVPKAHRKEVATIFTPKRRRS